MLNTEHLLAQLHFDGANAPTREHAGFDINCRSASRKQFTHVQCMEVCPEDSCSQLKDGYHQRRLTTHGGSWALQGAQAPGMQKWGLPAFAAAAVGAGVYYYNSRSGVVQAGQLIMS